MIYAWGITDKGVVRTQNQDSYYLKPAGDDLVVAMVCDGMGGARAGNVASSLAVETASAYLEELSREALLQDPGGHLAQAAARANEAVCYRAEQDIECRGMGTTMVAVILSGQKAHILNIGDSRAYWIIKSTSETIIKATCAAVACKIKTVFVLKKDAGGIIIHTYYSIIIIANLNISAIPARNIESPYIIAFYREEHICHSLRHSIRSIFPVYINMEISIIRSYGTFIMLIYETAS